MSLRNQQQGSSRPLRTEVFLCLFLGIGLCALAIPTITYSLIHEWLVRDFRSRALADVEKMAKESTYMVLVGSEANASRLLHDFNSRPDVVYAELIDAQKDAPLAQVGKRPPLRRIFSNYLRSTRHTSIAEETSSSWLVVSPLTITERERVFDHEDKPARADTVGYLLICISKERINRLLIGIAGVCIIVSIIVGLTSAWLFSRRLRWAVEPLERAATIMGGTAENRRSIRVPTEGFYELQTMAHAFNHLMVRLDEHAAQLEATVASRTRALNQALDAAEQAQRYKAALLAASTHGLQMPIFSIQAAARNALRHLEYINADTAAPKDSQLGILSASQELLLRVRSILADANTQGNRHNEFAPRLFNLQALAEIVRREAAPFATEQGNRLEVLYVGDQEVVSDSAKLFEIMVELVLNACKFTKAGRIEMAIHSATTALTIEVSNAGNLVNFSDTPNGPHGTGLGMEMVKRYTESLAGTVEWRISRNECTHSARVAIPLLAQAKARTFLSANGTR